MSTFDDWLKQGTYFDEELNDNNKYERHIAKTTAEHLLKWCEENSIVVHEKKDESTIKWCSRVVDVAKLKAYIEGQGGRI